LVHLRKLLRFPAAALTGGIALAGMTGSATSGLAQKPPPSKFYRIVDGKVDARTYNGFRRLDPFLREAAFKSDVLAFDPRSLRKNGSRLGRHCRASRNTPTTYTLRLRAGQEWPGNRGRAKECDEIPPQGIERVRAEYGAARSSIGRKVP
jgi:hypothetical protein